jgi:hypothetical protein
VTVRRRGANGESVADAFAWPEVTGQPPASRSPKMRRCPRCDARPGQSCVRKSGGTISGRDIGGGYAKPMKGFHAERSQPARRPEDNQGE